jgi:hypothetical protein
MRKSIGIIAPLCALSIIAGACKRVPDYVIQPEEMAQLMADIHVGEAVVDHNRDIYNNDSIKLAFKQSIYVKHGVTPEQVDTSFDWYGHNIGEYMDVYDRTIEILDARLSETGSRIAAEAALSIAGDSVDVWANPRSLAISRRLPSQMLTFAIKQDDNSEPGDSYTWRMKFANNTSAGRGGIVSEYTDGSKEVLNVTIAGDGWHDLTLYTDSTKTMKQIYGYISVVPEGEKNVWLDSIALVRNRLNANKYSQRYRQQHIPEPKK